MNLNVDRRAALCGLAAIPASAGLGSALALPDDPETPLELIERLVGELRHAMQTYDGRKWWVMVDLPVGLVALSRGYGNSAGTNGHGDVLVPKPPSVDERLKALPADVAEILKKQFVAMIDHVNKMLERGDDLDTIKRYIQTAEIMTRAAIEPYRL